MSKEKKDFIVGLQFFVINTLNALLSGSIMQLFIIFLNRWSANETRFTNTHSSFYYYLNNFCYFLIYTMDFVYIYFFTYSNKDRKQNLIIDKLINV